MRRASLPCLRSKLRYGKEAAIFGHVSAIHPAGCRSSVVEHSLGKGEVVSSILTGSTRKLNKIKSFYRRHGRTTVRSEICTHPVPTPTGKSPGGARASVADEAWIIALQRVGLRRHSSALIKLACNCGASRARPSRSRSPTGDHRPPPDGTGVTNASRPTRKLSQKIHDFRAAASLFEGGGSHGRNKVFTCPQGCYM